MVEKSIGKRIREYRLLRNKTQQDIADALSISFNYVSAIERGVNAPSLNKLVGIMNYLECSADDIFIDVVDKSYEKKYSQLLDELSELPVDEQARIYEVVNTLVKTARKK